MHDDEAIIQALTDGEVNAIISFLNRTGFSAFQAYLAGMQAAREDATNREEMKERGY